MLNHEAAPETGVDPITSLELFVHRLAGGAWRLSLGVALGALAAHVMRRRHVHWSWAGLAAVWALAIRPVLAGAGSTVLAGAAFAALRGRRWHREDLEAGADLARLAGARVGPADLVARYLRRLTVPRCRRAHGRRGTAGGELVLGRDEHGREVPIPFSGEGGTHTLVVGATGSGKTVTQVWMAVRAIERGMGVVALDPKGDPDMREQLRRAAAAAGRGFIDWTPRGPFAYNPYARGSESEIADKALAGERFSEPHYLRQAQRYVGHVVRALRRAGVQVSLPEIVAHMDPLHLEALARGLPEGDARDAFAYLDSLTARQRSDLSGVRDRLAILCESDVGPWLDPGTAGARSLDLLECVRARAVLYFELESDTRPLLAQMLGAAIVQDLQTAVAALQARPVPTLVVIDEFSALAAEHVVRLFARARSAGFNLLLGTQELADLRVPGRGQLLEQVMGNLSVLVAHRQVVPESAALIASLAGARGAWRTTRLAGGALTRTRVSERALAPDEVARLGVGRAAVIELSRGLRVSFVRVNSAREG